MIADAAPGEPATASSRRSAAGAPASGRRGRGPDSTRFRRDERGECGRRRRRRGGRRRDSGAPADAERAPAAAAARGGEPSRRRSRPAQKSRQRQPSAKTQARLAAASALVMPPLHGRARRGPAPFGARSSKAGQRRSPAPRGSWIIQIGAADDPVKANALLTLAREREPLDPRLGQASHRKGAQRRRHPLSRALRGPRFGLGGSGLPFAQAQRIFLLHRPRLIAVSDLLRSPSSLVAASEHPWPD